jgi:Ca2+-binding RTX toxin-like protein
VRRSGSFILISAVLLAIGIVVPVRADTVPLCFGRTATIVGTSGDDDGHANPVIEGTAGADVIVGLGGNDVIDGNGGDDHICGNAGRDDLDTHEDAAAGNDHLLGGGGPDCAVGSWSDTESGLRDVIRGGSQNDRCLTGGPGNDLVAGGSGDDFLNGNAGDDMLRGGVGNDRVDDTFPGSDDTDILSGNAGIDYLFADDGDALDSLDGGAQLDTCKRDVIGGAEDVTVNCESTS